MWEWVTNNNSTVNGADAYVSTLSGGDIRQTRYGASAFCAVPGSSPYCGMGQAYVNASAGSIVRGGPYPNGESTGIFSAQLGNAITDTSTTIGFRCVFIP